MDKLFSLATLDLVKLMALIDGVEPMDLAEREEDIEYSFETIREEVFLDIVYGELSRLDAHDWIKIVSSEKIAGWCF